MELGSSLRELDLAAAVPWTHIDCMWVVTQKHQYDAQKGLRKNHLLLSVNRAEMVGRRYKVIADVISHSFEVSKDNTVEFPAALNGLQRVKRALTFYRLGVGLSVVSA